MNEADIGRMLSRLVSLEKGTFVDKQNGVDLSFTIADLSKTSVYAFGTTAASYVLSKKPPSLERFLAKYSHLKNTDRFVYPLNIEKSKINDVTIIANALLQCAELMSEDKTKEELHQKAVSGIAMDVYKVFKEVFPKYSEKTKMNEEDYALEEFSLLRHSEDEDSTVYTVSAERMTQIFTLGLYSICTENDIPKRLVVNTFPLIANNANIEKFLSYDVPVRKFGENPSNYMDCELASARKCKNFASLLSEIVQYYTKDAEEEMATYGASEEEAMDDYVYELVTILLMNGFNVYEEITKNDVIVALQTRSAFYKYNGEEFFDRNKIIADLIVSVISRKLKDAALQKQTTISKDTKVYVDENKRVEELEAKNKVLIHQNKELSEKLDQVKRKAGKEDSRMDSLEKKVKELEAALKEKEKELEEYRRVEEESRETDILPEVVERDYESILSKFTEENSTVMVGGNYNLVSKMKKILPNVTYVMTQDASKLTDELVKNARIILFKTDSVSHSLWEAALSKCNRYGVPYAYPKELTNTNALMRSMCEVIEEKLGIDLDNEVERDDI